MLQKAQDTNNKRLFVPQALNTSVHIQTAKIYKACQAELKQFNTKQNIYSLFCFEFPKMPVCVYLIHLQYLETNFSPKLTTHHEKVGFEMQLQLNPHLNKNKT